MTETATNATAQHFTDRAEKLALTLKHSTLSHRMGEWSESAAASITTTRATLDAVVLRKTTPMDAIQAGALRIDGDLSRFAVLFGLLEQPTGFMFDILTPGEAPLKAGERHGAPRGA